MTIAILRRGHRGMAARLLLAAKAQHPSDSSRSSTVAHLSYNGRPERQDGCPIGNRPRAAAGGETVWAVIRQELRRGRGTIRAETRTRIVNRRVASTIGVAISLALAGCGLTGGPPGSASAPGPSVSVRVGSSSPYSLYTHCGVLSATINGQVFYAAPALTDGQGNPPPGWGNPYDAGELTVQSTTTIDFHDASGHTAQFTIVAGRSPLRICS